MKLIRSGQSNRLIKKLESPADLFLLKIETKEEEDYLIYLSKEFNIRHLNDDSLYYPLLYSYHHIIIIPENITSKINRKGIKYWYVSKLTFDNSYILKSLLDTLNLNYNDYDLAKYLLEGMEYAKYLL